MVIEAEMTMQEWRDIQMAHPAQVIQAGESSIVLTTVCLACKGEGVTKQLFASWTSGYKIRKVPCDACEGTGMRLTADGKTLCDVMRAHMGGGR